MTINELFEKFEEFDCRKVKCEECIYENLCMAIAELLEDNDEN